MNAVLTFIIVSLCGISQALRLPVVSRSVDHAWPGVHLYTSRLPQNVDNAKDIVYATNITLGGKEFPIQLDTGSSDVWVLPPFPLDIANTTDLQTNLTFGIGQVTGNIAFAEMSLGPYHVPMQAFVNATNATDFGAIFKNDIYGILGLAFDQGSNVFVNTIEAYGRGNTQGRTFLGNIFAQNTSTPNFFTVLLGRTDDPDGPEEGIFTISEHDPDYAEVTKQPKLLRTPAQLKNLTGLPRWSVIQDKMTVNGQDFQFNTSSVKGVPEGSQVTVLDTGFTFSQIPPAAVDFIYSSIPGAVYNETSKLWVLPCDATTELSFQFGNTTFPVHPLDITGVKRVDNNTVCYNSFRAINLPPGADAGIDSILGVSFLKNAYASFDFGDWTPDEDTNGLPFVQMLPTTEPVEAMAEFRAARPKQVKEADESTVTAGSLSTTDPDEQGLNLISTSEIDKETAETIKRRSTMMVVSAQRMGAPVSIPIPPFPLPLPQRIRPCINAVLASYGPAVLALLAGILFLSLVTCVVGIILLARYWMSTEVEETQAYEPMLAKEDVLVEPRDYNATIYHD